MVRLASQSMCSGSGNYETMLGNNDDPHEFLCLYGVDWIMQKETSIETISQIVALRYFTNVIHCGNEVCKHNKEDFAICNTNTNIKEPLLVP